MPPPRRPYAAPPVAQPSSSASRWSYSSTCRCCAATSPPIPAWSPPRRIPGPAASPSIVRPQPPAFCSKRWSAHPRSPASPSIRSGPAPPRRFERGNTFRVRLDQGSLASVTDIALLGGANTAAIRNEDGEWEVLQFASAVLTAPATYLLSTLLRGQAGTELAMRSPVAAGARFVLLDGAPVQVDMTPDEVGLAFNWKCGPASRDIGNPSYLDVTHTFTGRGLVPLSPVHLRGTRSAGDLTITWKRRTRLGGDSWDSVEVPLGEDSERYEIDILDGSDVVRTLSATTPTVTYTAADQTADFGSPQSSVSVRIHQLSTTAGRGTPRSTDAVTPLPSGERT